MDKRIKRGLTPLGKIFNVLGIITYRIEEKKEFEDKTYIKWNQGLNFKNPLTWAFTPIIAIIVIVKGGISNLEGFFKRNTYSHYFKD